MKKFYTKLLVGFLFVLGTVGANAQVTVNPGAGSYATLKAAFDAINLGTHTGVITVDIVGNTTETASAVLNASGAGAASYTSITISPSGGVARTITGAITGHLIDLNGADNVTIDGLNNAGNALTISNTATGASSTIRFIGDAINNIVQKTTFQGSTTSFGVLFFSTGTTTGNDGNNINNCNITAAGANLPLNGIYSLGTGTVGIENSGVTINANNISDYFSAGSATNGMNINTGNTTWSITNNKLFQSATRIYTAASTHNGINITTGDGYTITGNTIGFANTSGTGTTNIVGSTVALTGAFPSSYTVTGTPNATRYIALNCTFNAAGAVSSIQNNTIAGFALYTSSGATTTTGIFCAIAVNSGNANIGTTTGNTIGATSGTGSIYTACTSTGGMAAGIYVTSTNTVTIQNNTIGAIDAMGTTATVSGGINGINVAGAGNFTVVGNTIGNATNPNIRMGNLTTGANLSNVGTTFGIASGVGAFKGILAASTGATKIIGNVASPNIIRNASLNSNSTTATFRGIEIIGAAGVPVVSANSISNITSASTNVTLLSGGVAGIGIYVLSGATGSTLAGNFINTLSLTNTTTTGTNLAGISTAATTVTISKNLIYGLSNASTSTSLTLPGTASGILLRSGVALAAINVSNNMISLGVGETSNTSFIGIWGQHGSTPDPITNIYFNSINIEGSASSGTQPSFGYLRGDFSITARTPTVDIRNNIFTNTRTGGTGKHYAIANNYGATASVTGWGTNASNNNVLNGTAANIGYWTTDQTFATWKTASASDAASLSGITVTFVNTATGNLHLNMGVTPTQIESGGVTGTGITDDYDNQVRPGPAGSVNGGATAPDLGADEFDGVPLDLTAPTITYTPFIFTCLTTARTLTTTITDASGVPTSGLGLPVLYWKINALAYTAVTATWVSGSTYTFTFGAGVVAGDVVSYYIVAQDNAPTPNVGSAPSGASGFTINPPAASTPPATPSSYTISSSIGGSYNVGSTGTYLTLTAAIAAYNTSCLTSAVTFLLTDASYTEASAMTINANPDASAVKTLTIKPTLANTTIAVTSGSATAIFILNGADYVTIDGSINTTANTVCPLSAASRDLTITNTNAGTTSAVVWLQTTAGADAATNNRVINCNLVGNSNTTTLFGVGSGSATIGIASLGTGNNNNNFINNNISKTQYGIFSQGASAANKNTGTIINQNLINTVTPNNVQIGGIYIGFDNGAVISRNSVSGMVSGTDAFGISTGVTSWVATTTTGNEVSNVTISKNTVGLVQNTGANSAAGILSGSSATGTNQVSNNMIYGVISNSTPGDITAGIFTICGVGATQVYYNTVSMTGDRGASTTGSSLALAVMGTDPTIDIRNNILINKQTTASTGKSYAIGLGYSTFVNLTSNYNDLFTSGANANFGVTGTLNSGTDRTTLALWQAATGKDANSKNLDAVFISATDLHLNVSSNSGLNASATTVSSTDDIDCDTRDITTPDIGADEFTPPVITDAGITAIVLSNPFCPGSNLVSATVRNYGTTTLTSVLIDWSVTPGGAQPQVNPGAISIAAGASQTFPLGNFTFAAGTTYSITAFTSSPNGGADAVPGNDSYTQNNITTGLVGTYTVGVGMNYTTLTAAVADYNTKSLCGAVIFSLTDATYPSETFPITINANAAANVTNTLTIKPATTSAISGSSATGLIILNGADYVTINGSNAGTANTVCPVSAASRNLTLTNTSSSTSSAVIWLQTTVATDAATNNKVISCNLVGNSNTTTLIGVGSGSATISISSLGTGNNNNSFINNNISKTQYGIYAQGASAANKNTGTVINQNLVNTASPNNVQIGGIYIGFDNGAVISGNSVSGMVSGTDAFGISTGVNSWIATTTTGNEVSNATISKNVIGLVQNTGANSAAGILVGPSSTGTNQVSNNMAYGVISNSTPGDITAGIFAIGGAGATQVYYNTVSMTGDRGASTTGSSLALAVMGTDPIIDIRNNIFVNKQTTASTGKSYAIGLGYATFVNLTSDYNDLFTSGANGNFGVTGTLNAGTDRTSLALWQAATGKDAASINVDPIFISATDLHVVTGANPAINNAATPISVPDDIDCITRNATTPDMGADEFTPIADDAGVTAIVLPSPFCAGAQTIQATIKNFGTATLTSVLVDWTVTPGGAQPQVNPAINLAPGASVTITLGSFTFAAGTTYSITATTSLPNGNPDGNTANDATTLSGIYTGLSGNYNVGAGGDFTTLTAAAAAYNTRSLCGAVVFTLTDASYSGSETFPITFNNNVNASAVNTLIIRPAATAVISGSSATASINLNGGQYITIDGRIGSTGTTHSLTITNTLATGPAVLFINDAANNTIKYTDIKSDNTTTTSGVIFFSTTTGANGNDNNAIDNCNVGPNVANPTNGIYSSGTTTLPAQNNSSNTISNNNIFDFYNFTSTSNAGVGVNISAGNTDWTISGNSFYQTATRTTFGSGATFNGILLSNSTGNNFAVLNNFIGGTAPNAGGTPLTLNTTATLVVRLIQATVGATTATSIQGNTIQNIAVTTASTSTAQALISAVTGSFNIGNGTGNILGSTTGTGNISFTQSTLSTSPVFSGINVGSGTPGDINVSNNSIGSISVSNSSTGTVNFRGISINGAVISSTVNNNIVGSAGTANSININIVTPATTNTAYGIEVASGITVANSISGNTVANMSQNSTSTTTLCRGISYAGIGFATISNNIIHDLSSASSNATVSGGATAIQGILYTGTSTTGATISLNEIYAISATNTGAVQTNSTGIGYSNPNAGVITRNKIYDIRNASTMAVATTPPTAIGLLIRAAPSGGVSITNNMISLGSGQSTNTEFLGILNSFTNSGNALYFNSVNIEGAAASGNLPSFAFLRGDNTATSAITSPVDLRDNIFNNTRSGGTGSHYAIGNNYGSGTSSATGWGAAASNYNLLNANATTIGYWNTAQTFAGWQTASASDANSISAVTPIFVNTVIGNLHLSANNCSLDDKGTPIAGITTDYDAQTRNVTTPDIGADEFTALSGTLAATVGGAQVCSNALVDVSGTTYKDPSCNAIARVLPSGGAQVAGMINACVTIDATVQTTPNSEPYVQRHFDIQPATNPTTATGRVTLYALQSEFNAYNAFAPAFPQLPVNSGDVTGIGNLRVTQYNGTGTLPQNYTGTKLLINPADVDIVWNATNNWWEISFNVTGFGGFYIHTTLTNAPLPITINYFTGIKQGSNHLLNWKVTCQNSARATMTLERSADSRNFTGINTITADAARCNQPFSYTDAQPFPGMNYYRLKMVDDNGTISYSGIVALLNSVKGFDIISIAPNPVTTGNFKLNVTSATAATMQVIITDMQGRIVSRQSIPVIAGFSSIPMNVSNLAAGTYSIQAIFADEKTKLIRFVKQ